MKDSTQRAIRWGELLAPLEAKAHEEGATVPARVRRVVRAYLGINCAPPSNVALGRGVRGTVSAFGWLTIRPGRLGDALEKRALEEKTTTSEIARRAIRLYLANEELPDIRQFAQELRSLQKNMARIGGNLNQIAVAFNSDGVLRTSDLRADHRSLVAWFSELASYFKRLEKQLDAKSY